MRLLKFLPVCLAGLLFEREQLKVKIETGMVLSPPILKTKLCALTSLMHRCYTLRVRSPFESLNLYLPAVKRVLDGMTISKERRDSLAHVSEENGHLS